MMTSKINRKFSKKIVYTLLAISIVVLFILMMKPRVDHFDVLTNPRIPDAKKAEYVAEKRIKELGHDHNKFSISAKKEDLLWNVAFVPKDKKDQPIHVIVNDKFEIVDVSYKKSKRADSAVEQ